MSVRLQRNYTSFRVRGLFQAADYSACVLVVCVCVRGVEWGGGGGVTTRMCVSTHVCVGG